MDSFLFDSLHHGMGNVLDLRQQQHSLTASNLANADTPGFKARVIPFDKVLAEAVGERADMPLRKTDIRHHAGLDTDPKDPDFDEIEAPPWSVDGNSVIAEREAVRLAENAMMYRAVTRGLSKRMSMLKYAATNGQQG